MFEKWYLWLFNFEERQPISFIAIFFMIIVISIIVSLFVVSIDRHVQGIVGYLFQ